MPTVRLRRPVRGVVPGPRALPRCHLRLQREEGGFLGAMTINYVVAAAVWLVVLVTWLVLDLPDVHVAVLTTVSLGIAGRF